MDVIGLLKSSATRFHQTIVLITHNEEIAQMADRIIHIKDGRLVQRKVGRTMSLIQNNNQAVIRRLAWRSLKMNRFRTICTLITIFICTFVMAIVPLINTASIETFYIDFRDEAHGSYIIDTARSGRLCQER